VCAVPATALVDQPISFPSSVACRQLHLLDTYLGQASVPSVVHRIVAALIATQQEQLDQLKSTSGVQTETIEQQQQLIEKLQHEIGLLKRHIFGQRRERFIDPRQGKLFEIDEELEKALQSDGTARFVMSALWDRIRAKAVSISSFHPTTKASHRQATSRSSPARTTCLSFGGPFETKMEIRNRQ
jgi:hypothetical protein